MTLTPGMLPGIEGRRLASGMIRATMYDRPGIPATATRATEAATKRRLAAFAARPWAAFAAGLAGSALAGLAAGLVWAAVAPRPLLEEVAPGAAQLVNAESSAYITGDAWFVLIAVTGGVITGALGYRLLVRGAGWAAAAGLILGAVAAALLALWIGENIGLAGYQHQLASARPGTFFRASLGLGAKSALAFWPMLTSFVIALAETGARRAGQAPPDASGMWTGEQ